MASWFVGVYLAVCMVLGSKQAFGLFEFPTVNHEIPGSDIRKLSKLNEATYLRAIDLATESLRRNERLESSLRSSNVLVVNGSVSHAQLLETFPSQKAQQYDSVARLILHSSLYFLNSECRPSGIEDETCAKFLSEQPLPDSPLKEMCVSAVNSVGRDGPFEFRRLLPAHYKNGISEMFKEPDVPSPRTVSLLGANSFQDSSENVNNMNKNVRNIALVQWAQFIEHDLSKSVVTTMKDGTPIECCDKDNKQLKPRYRHPACAPIKGPSGASYGREPCLNYVRSALAVDKNCHFGTIEMLNQATNLLDLSQLYGFSSVSQRRMRTFQDGLLKTSVSGSSTDLPFLPFADDSAKFCVNHAESCFMAGDSRVNSNPFMTLIYTIFLRSHNRIAKRLSVDHPNWDDQMLYNEARRRNIDIYRCIIYNEWLPAVVGSDTASNISNEPISAGSPRADQGVSNEFAVAAIRFYYSMMPDVLHGARQDQQSMIERNVVDPVSSDSKIFALKHHFFESEFISRPDKMDEVMAAMMQQKAMDMDSNYVEDLTSHYLQTKSSLNKTSGIDALAWDIQRGRDHGLAGYVKYLEICTKTKISNWNDLVAYINRHDLNRLKRVYQTYDKIDLIVGGISEKPTGSGILGPTFTCILGEQFSNSRRYHWIAEGASSKSMETEECMTSHRFLCENTGLQSVPRNIFYTVSNSNPLVSCNRSA